MHKVELTCRDIVYKEASKDVRKGVENLVASEGVIADSSLTVSVFLCVALGYSKRAEKRTSV